jgi:hypothetical protein
MKSPRIFMATAAAIALVAMVVGSFTERKAIAGAIQAVLVHDVDNPARQPFATECDVQFAGLGCTVIVPEDKRLVIETVTATLALPEGEKPLNFFVSTVASGLFKNANHALVAHFMGRGRGAVHHDYYAISESIRLYAAPGSTVLLEGQTTTAPPETEDDILTMSGYFVDFP